MFRRRKQSQLPNTTTPPPFCQDGIYRCASIDELLAHHSELYRALRKEIDFAPKEIDEFFVEPIRRLCALCDTLPASRDSLYRQPASLLAKCLRTAFRAHRIAHGKVVSTCRPADARANEERAWRYAAMLGGLIYPLGVLAQLGVKGVKTGRRWRYEYGPVAKWLKSMGESTYREYWFLDGLPHTDMNSARLWALQYMMTPAMAAFIGRESDDHLQELLGLLHGSPKSLSLLAPVVAEAAHQANVYEAEAAVSRLAGLPMEEGFERLKSLVTYATQEAIKDPANSVIRRTGDSVCALWPRFAEHLRVTAARHNLLGFSEHERSNDTLLDELEAAGVIVATRQGRRLHDVAFADGRSGALSKAVVFAHPIEHTDVFPMVELYEGETEAKNAIVEAPVEREVPETERPSAETGTGVENQTPDETREDGENAAQVEPKDSTSALHTAVGAFHHLGSLGRLLEKAQQRTGEEPGWWTDKGRALPWPKIAKDAEVPPAEFLRALNAEGVAVEANRGPLPLIHEVTREGAHHTAVIIATEAWRPSARGDLQ